MKPLAILFAGFALAATAAGQNDVPRPAERPAEERAEPANAPFVFEAGVVELRTLIERCGAYLQRNIIVESDLWWNPPKRPKPAPAAARGAPAAAAEGPIGPFVELQLPVVTDRDGCEEMLTSLLWTRSLALVPLDEKRGVYEVIAMTGPRSREIAARAVPRTPKQVLARPSLRLFVNVVVQLKHVDSTMAVNALRPFFQGPVPVAIDHLGTASSLVLTGPQDQVANALVLLDSIDMPQPRETRPVLTRLDMLTYQLEMTMHENAQLARRVAELEEKLEQKR